MVKYSLIFHTVVDKLLAFKMKIIAMPHYGSNNYTKKQNGILPTNFWFEFLNDMPTYLYV